MSHFLFLLHVLTWNLKTTRQQQRPPLTLKEPDVPRLVLKGGVDAVGNPPPVTGRQRRVPALQVPVPDAPHVARLEEEQLPSDHRHERQSPSGRRRAAERRHISHPFPHEATHAKRRVSNDRDVLTAARWSDKEAFYCLKVNQSRWGSCLSSSPKTTFTTKPSQRITGIYFSVKTLSYTVLQEKLIWGGARPPQRNPRLSSTTEVFNRGSAKFWWVDDNFFFFFFFFFQPIFFPRNFMSSEPELYLLSLNTSAVNRLKKLIKLITSIGCD